MSENKKYFESLVSVCVSEYEAYQIAKDNWKCAKAAGNHEVCEMIEQSLELYKKGIGRK